MRGRVALEARDFSGGVNLSVGPEAVARNEAGALLNFRPTLRGSLKSRTGDTNLLGPAALGAQAMVSLAAFEESGIGSTDTLIASMADGSLHYYNGVSPTSAGTFTPNALWSWVYAPFSGAQGPIYGVNGTIAKYIDAGGAVANWTAATGTLPATADHLAYVGNRVWAAGMSSYGALADPGSALVFSEIGDPRNWPAANVVVFDANDGEAITGIGEVGSGLLVFKRSKAWLVYDLDTGANRPLGVGVGCISHRSIVPTPYGTVWAAERQIWVSDGATVQSLADPIISAIPGTPAAEQILVAGSPVTAVFHDGRYLFSSASAGEVDIYEYDFASKSWWLDHGLGGLLAQGLLTGDARPQVYAGGNSRLDRMFTTGYAYADGTPLLRTWQSPFHSFGSGRDRLRGLEIEGSGHFGVAALPAYNVSLPGGYTAREIRDEQAVATVRREFDFPVSNGVQITFYAVGQDLLTSTAIPGYVPGDVQVDAYSLYVTPRPG